MAKGAPTGNANAEGHGLYASQPLRVLKVQADVGLPELAEYAEQLGDYALWIAATLSEVSAQNETLDGHRLISLYASVAQELNQLAAELAGETGIKAAALGQLSDAQYDVLMFKQARAIELILNQCVGAARRIQIAEEILGEARKIDAIKTSLLSGAGGLISIIGDVAIPNPVLQYLAGHMRVAKRMIREAAANRAWKVRGADDGSNDLSARLQKQIGGNDGE